MEDTVMDESLESVQWGHGQCMSKLDRMIATLGAEELKRQQRSAAGSMASEVPRDMTLLQQEEKEKECLRKLHERSSRSPPSVPQNMSMRRQEDILSSLMALQQGPTITKIASDDVLLAELRSLFRAAEAEAEALQKMRVQTQIDRDHIGHERQHAHQGFTAMNEELAVKNDGLAIKNEELTIKDQKELTSKDQELADKSKELTDTVTGLAQMSTKE
ncbi:hypothetical protein KC323_g7429 [Hortaea werneckii]|nr:hypothetical protein KC323_g7429 [Hortaea werneckii]KAI7351617.1 hypothetical protein KC320_g4824 [Hortaea werneckii]